jgi:hypothetical protein
VRDQRDPTLPLELDDPDLVAAVELLALYSRIAPEQLPEPAPQRQNQAAEAIESG